jgi:glyoxylase-like metal-dependent hydrolase (beta-lactamase superfamily II)
MHRDDIGASLSGIERVISGSHPVELDQDLIAIPTPGHTRGHTALLYKERYLFTGDHLWWSEAVEGLVASRSVCWYSWTEQIRSMELLLEYRFEWVLPGHGRRIKLETAKMRHELERCLDRMRRTPGRAAS